MKRKGNENTLSSEKKKKEEEEDGMRKRIKWGVLGKTLIC